MSRGRLGATDGRPGGLHRRRAAAGGHQRGLVLEHDFATGGGEIVRVFLERGQVYRAEMTTPDVTLQIRAVRGKIKPPRVYNVLGPEASSTQSEVEVYPDVDADYEIKPISGASSGVGTRLRLYRDVSESHRRMAIMDKPG
jgi:hypothetical protein